MAKKSVETETLVIPFANVIADSADNARTVLSGIEELAANIKVHGLLHPLIVTHETGDFDDRYRLRGGFRRYYALESLGVERVSVTVVSDEFATAINLSENLARVDISSYDFAKALHRMSEDGLSGKKISSLIVSSRQDDTGCSVSNINNLIRIFRELHPTILEAWQGGHPAATKENLFTIVSKPDQLAAWSFLTNAASPGMFEDGEKKEEKDTDPVIKPRRRKPGECAAIIERMKATKGVTGVSITAAEEALQWALGVRATICGVGIDDA